MNDTKGVFSNSYINTESQKFLIFYLYIPFHNLAVFNLQLRSLVSVVGFFFFACLSLPIVHGFYNFILLFFGLFPAFFFPVDRDLFLHSSIIPLHFLCR